MLWSIPLLFLTLFFIYPLSSILLLSLAPQGSLDLSGFATIITSAYYRETIVFTLTQAALSTLLTLVLAVPCAYVFARYTFRGKSLLLTLSILPFVLPTVVVAAAFSALIGSNGILNNWLMAIFNLSQPPIQLERTLTLVILAHVFYNFPIALRIVTAFWSNQSPRLDEAARTLGVHGWRLWWRVYLPAIQPAITAAALLVFVFTFTSFGIVLLLGGPRYATLEVEIYRQATGVFNLQIAAALSLVQIGFMFVIMLVYTHLQSRMNSGQSKLQPARTISRPAVTLKERLTIHLVTGFMLVLLFTPLLALIVQSLSVRQEAPTLRYYIMLAANPRNSILSAPPLASVSNSFIIAAAAVFFALFLGVVAAYFISRRGSRFSSWVDPLFMLPLATSAVTLGFGYVIALNEPPLNLRSSILILPLAHALVALPFVIRSVLPVKQAISPAMYEAAHSLGASPIKILRVIDLPLISRGLIVGAAFAFTISIGEFGATLFLARPDTLTMPVVISRLLGQPGAANYGQALAMSTVLLFVCGVSFLAIERFRAFGDGEF